jgi:chromosome segregation ATPase
MCRKIAIAVGAVMLGLVILYYTPVASLVKVAWNDTTSWLDSQVPVETRIKQLKLKADQMDGEIKANCDKLAKMEMEIRGLEQQVASLKNDQSTRRTEITAKAEKLRNLNEKVSLRDKTKLTNELDVAVSSYEVKDVKIKSLQDMIAAKKETLEAAQKKVGDMRDLKDQLYLTIAKLETRKELVDIKTQQSQIQVSDSLMSECNALAKKIDDQLTERELQAKNYEKFGVAGDNGTVLTEKEAKPAKDVLQRVNRILAEDDK